MRLAPHPHMCERNAAAAWIWNRSRQGADVEIIIIDDKFARFSRRPLQINSPGRAVRQPAVPEPAKGADLSEIESRYDLIIDGDSTSTATTTTDVDTWLPILPVGPDLSGTGQCHDINTNATT